MTSFDGSKMDGWGFSIRAEGANGANADLVPDREPDTEPWSFFLGRDTLSSAINVDLHCTNQIDIYIYMSNVDMYI